MLKNHPKLSPRGYPDLWRPLEPQGSLKTSMFNDFDSILVSLLTPKSDQNSNIVWTLFGDPLWRAFWELRASISRAFANNFGYFLGPEWKSENCDIVEARTLPRGFERVTFSTCVCTFSSMHFWHKLCIVVFTIVCAFGQPFWTLLDTFSTLFFKHDFKTLKVHKNCARMVSPIGGPTSKLVVYLPLSDSPPLILSLKGTL